MQRLILSSLVLLIMTGCWFKSQTLLSNTSELSVESEPIYLVHQNIGASSFYFILSRHFKDNAQDYKVLVRWRSNDDRGNFALKNNTLKFLIDNFELMSLEQISKPILIGKNFDSGQMEEECFFKVTRQQLERLASAKHVNVELTGKGKIIKAKFGRLFTFGAFKQFLRHI
jgi:hypothetical protein